VSKDHVFHEVRQYLTRLEWDGVKRAEGWLNLYMGVSPTDYSQAVGLRWLVSAVARIMQPGVKADCCLILEGPQGILKSTAVRRLGEPWTTDELGDVGGKDAAMQIAGVWLVELAELDSLARGEAGRIKAFMSRAVDRFRPPYGRHVVPAPRQCVFVGSVNHSSYLKDETGGRRFWPVVCTRVLIDQLARDRDQLWAEAVHLYRAGAPWWLDDSGLVRAAEAEQRDRYEGDSWDPLIASWIDGQLKAGETSVSTREILEGCIKKPAAQLGQGDSMRVARYLRSSKWERVRMRMPNGENEWRFRPPVPTSGGNSDAGRNSGTL
jgi:putative DNA primase/helicase